MTTCQNCGNELLEGAVFCGSCGSAVTPTATPVDPAGASWGISTQGSSPSNKPTSYNRNLLVAVIAGVVIVAGIVAGIVVATSGRPSPVTPVNGLFSDLNSGNFRGACSYVLPSQRSTCSSQLPSTSSIQLKFTYHVTKVVVDGNRAIVGTIGHGCFSGQCSPFGSSSDPIPGLSKGFNKAFSKAVAAASSSSASSSPGAVPCVFQNGHWYLDLP